jgi:hypothetical protein
MRRRALILAALAGPAAALAAGCGYKRVDSGSTLSKQFKTIAVPTFRNPSLRYRVEQRFTDAVTRELLKRERRLRVVSENAEPDLLLTGEVKDVRSGGALLDDTGRTRVFQVVIVVGVTLRDMKNARVLFDNQRFTFRGEYELSGDPESFFNEENPAFDRIAADFAASVVSTITLGGM